MPPITNFIERSGSVRGALAAGCRAAAQDPPDLPSRPLQIVGNERKRLMMPASGNRAGRRCRGCKLRVSDDGPISLIGTSSWRRSMAVDTFAEELYRGDQNQIRSARHRHT